MENRVKHQHYVPQMYLKRFANKEGQLYAYDLVNQKGYYNIPRAFAHEKFFYDVDKSTLRSFLAQYETLIEPDLADSLAKEQLAEHMLAKIEENASKILTALDLGKLSIEDEHVHVAFGEYHVKHNLSAMENLFAGYINARLDKYLKILQD